MNLILDIGNTRTKVALFDGDRLVEKHYWTDWTAETLAAWTQGREIGRSVLSATGNVPAGTEAWLSEHYRHCTLAADTPVPVANRYTTPHTLGKDRLAAVTGACQLYPETHCLVIDAGTCVTYDFVSAQGEYLGGSISPGATMRLQAMHAFTARLPRVEARLPKIVTGDSTETALQSGALWGLVFEAEGFIRHYTAQYGRLQTLLTGGDGEWLYRHIQSAATAYEPELVLIGLNKIANYHAATGL